MLAPSTPRSLFSRVLTLIALLVAGALSCSDDPAAPEEPDDSNVSVESSNREVATIGAAGGSVSTTSNAGVTYTLDVPAGALPGDVEIAITPVTAINNLPFEGRLEGAVRLGPSGLQLLVPAVLTIDASPTTTGAERLVGFAYEGDASSFEPSAAIDGTTNIRVVVTHFSGAGAAASESADDWLATMCASVPTLDWPISSQFECWDGAEPQRDWFIRFARDYMEDILTPLAQGGGEISTAVTEYIEWYHACDQLAERFQATDWETVFADEITTLQELLETELVASVAEAKTALCAQGGTEHLRLLFEYRHLVIAASFEETTGLRDEDILEDLCAEIRIPEITLADPMPMNQGTSLDARAELWINNQRQDALFNFRILTVHGTSTCAGGGDFCEGRSNGLGEYTVVVTRTAPGLVEIDVTAALVMPLFVTNASGAGYSLVETPLRSTETIIRETYALATTFPSSVDPETATTLAVVLTRDNPGGIPTPIEGAQVRFNVDGGTADPTSGTTDADGRVMTQITANDGPNRVVVEIEALLNNEVVVTKTVEAAIDSAEPEGDLLLDSRYSQILGWVPYPDDCTGDIGVMRESSATGPIDVLEDANMSCVFFDETTAQASASARQISDPGFAADGRSALISFTTVASASVSTTSPDGWEAQFHSSMLIAFRVLEGNVAYEVEASYGGNLGKATVSMMGTSTNVNWEKEAGDSNPITFATFGTLPPGGFTVGFDVMGEAKTSGAGSKNGNCQVTATIRLTAASPGAIVEIVPRALSARDSRTSAVRLR